MPTISWQRAYGGVKSALALETGRSSSDILAFTPLKESNGNLGFDTPGLEMFTPKLEEEFQEEGISLDRDKVGAAKEVRDLAKHVRESS